MKLNYVQHDRARGAVLGLAVGDALGAPYEFGSRALDADGPAMLGGGLGNFAPGEWTDDTAMAWCVLDVASTVHDIRTEQGLTAIAHRFRGWYDSGPADIGNQTRTVLRTAGPTPTGSTMTATAYDLHARTGHTAGNGSLMRTAPVALRYLNDPLSLVQAARRISALTHYDPQAQEACALWSLAIRHAILHGEFDLRTGLEHLDPQAALQWAQFIDDAERHAPGKFRPNGWVVTALQAAWSAVFHTPEPSDDPGRHLSDALTVAIGIGDDTDTVAAIAGALLGARWGTSAIRPEWQRILHGYPGITGDELIALVDGALEDPGT